MTSAFDYSGYSSLLIERRDHGILWVTINQPDTLNAVDAPSHSELTRLWLDIADDSATRVVVVTGAGDAFSAGGDLDWVRSMAGDYDQVKATMKEAGELVMNILRCDKLIVSAINGVAVGAGLAVALLADISLMADEARLTDGHQRLGVAAGDHAAILWPLLCGLAKAKYYLLTADFIDGKEAERIGLVSRSVPRADLIEEAERIATKLATGSQHAAQLTKRSLNLWLYSAVPHFDASLGFEMLNFMGPDVVEGTAAIKERRKPDYPSARDDA